MILTIDSKACEKYGITLEEFLILYLNAKNINVNSIGDSLVSKQIADRDLFTEGNLILSSKTKQLVSRILLDSTKIVQANEERIKNLAQKLKEIYIPGKKEGAGEYFKSNSAEVEQKLKQFFVEYGDHFTDEQILTATKRYIDSFNGDYRYAQYLKYFIGKKVDGEKGSKLLTYLENLDQPEVKQASIDWDVELR